MIKTPISLQDLRRSLIDLAFLGTIRSRLQDETVRGCNDRHSHAANSGVFQRKWCKWPDTFALNRLVQAFEFPVRLRIVPRCAHVGHARDANKFFESQAMNCGPLSLMIRGLASGYFSLAPFEMISMSTSFIDSRRSQCTRIDCIHPARCTGSKTYPIC